MTIPAKYQIFPKTVHVSDKDHARLTPLISSWRSLAPLIGDTNAPDLERMIVIELMTHRRAQMLDKLVARWSRLNRIDLWKQVEELL